MNRYTRRSVRVAYPYCIESHFQSNTCMDFNLLVLMVIVVTTVTTTQAQEPACCDNSHLLGFLMK